MVVEPRRRWGCCAWHDEQTEHEMGKFFTEYRAREEAYEAMRAALPKAAAVLLSIGTPVQMSQREIDTCLDDIERALALAEQADA